MKTLKQPERLRVSLRKLYGPSYPQVDSLRRRIAGSPSHTFVYRERPGATEILLSNHEIDGRNDLMAVYDRSVTNGMLRADLYGESEHNEETLT